jgi:aryl-alcohol dehydrogenase-like predicted oxidoreductase
MDYRTLGRTGLKVSVMGLGAGGHSRLGQGTGHSVDESVGVVRRALDLGVNFIDTAEVYGTEQIVGEGIRGRARDRVVLSTKKAMGGRDGGLISGDELARGLEESLRRLGTDHVEVYHLHGVSAEQYVHAREHLVPAMRKLRDEGKIRFIGITEAFASDPGHRTLSQAVQDDCWDVVMVGFNILNQSGRSRVLKQTLAKGIGTLNMFAVRAALSRAEKLRQTVEQLVQQRVVASGDIDDASDPLGFVVRDGGAAGVTDAAYRFCRSEPGIDVVLSGTGSIPHLEENVASLLRPALPEPVRQRLMRIFANVDSVSGQ